MKILRLAPVAIVVIFLLSGCGIWPVGTLLSTFSTTVSNIKITSSTSGVQVGSILLFSSSFPGAEEYVWDFGDNTTAVGKTVSHIFGVPSTYNVKLTIVLRSSHNLLEPIGEASSHEIDVGSQQSTLIFERDVYVPAARSYFINNEQYEELRVLLLKDNGFRTQEWGEVDGPLGVNHKFNNCKNPEHNVRHTGVDYGANPVPVFSATSGKVIDDNTQFSSDFGRIAIHHAESNATFYYLHLGQKHDEFGKIIKTGDLIYRGQKIGTVGNVIPGSATVGNHLHFEARPGRRAESAGCIEEHAGGAPPVLNPYIAVKRAQWIRSYDLNNQSNASPGDTITFRYGINNPTSLSVSVTLGAQLSLNGGTPIDDPSNDVSLSLAQGNNANLSRQFKIPASISSETYDAHWVVYEQGNPGNVFDRVVVRNAITINNGTSSLPNPVSHYKFDESSGTTTADSSGNGHVGTLNGGATFSSLGISGNAILLDGTDGYVSIADSSDLDLNEMTISAWVNYISILPAPDGNQGIVNKYRTDQPNEGGYELFIREGTGDVDSGLKDDSGNITGASNSISAGSWHHIGLTYDGSTIKLYVNGVLKDSETKNVTVTPNSLPLIIGALMDQNSTVHRFFKGRIDEVQIFDEALSQDQIQSLFNNP